MCGRIFCVRVVSEKPALAGVTTVETVIPVTVTVVMMMVFLITMGALPVSWGGALTIQD